jgi:hypothetical protein
MSRFGFVTPNDPPRAPGTPKPRKNQPGHPPGPRKMPRKIAKAARLIFQNWKSVAASNETSTNSVVNERHLKCATTHWILNRHPMASQESALRPLLFLCRIRCCKFFVGGQCPRMLCHKVAFKGVFAAPLCTIILDISKKYAAMSNLLSEYRVLPNTQMRLVKSLYVCVSINLLTYYVHSILTVNLVRTVELEFPAKLIWV